MVRALRIILGFLVLNGANAGAAEPLPPASATGMGNTRIEIQPVTLEVLIRAAALGNMQEIKNSKLHVRLYGYTVAGSCIPESHQVCANRYVLTTSSFDEAPVINAYDLGQVGEITAIKFIFGETEEDWRLELDVLSYPRSAKRSNPRLAHRSVKVRLHIGEESLQPEDAADQP